MDKGETEMAIAAGWLTDAETYKVASSGTWSGLSRSVRFDM